MIKKYGFPVESHTVVTEDGYILNLFRIPGKRRTYRGLQEQEDDENENKFPVLLNHGLFANGHIWLMQHGLRNLGRFN